MTELTNKIQSIIEVEGNGDGQKAILVSTNLVDNGLFIIITSDGWVKYVIEGSELIGKLWFDEITDEEYETIAEPVHSSVVENLITALSEYSYDPLASQALESLGKQQNKPKLPEWKWDFSKLNLPDLPKNKTPILKGCPNANSGAPCFCTGACMEVVGHE